MSNLYDFLNFIFKEDKERYEAVYGKDWENKVNDGYDIRDEDGKGITDTEHAKWQVHQSTPKPDDHKYSGDIWNWHQNVPTSDIEAGEMTPHPNASGMGFGGEKFPGTNLARYLGHNESEDDFEPGKVHLTSRDARWVYLADDTADKEDAPASVHEKPDYGFGDVLGYIPDYDDWIDDMINNNDPRLPKDFDEWVDDNIDFIADRWLESHRNKDDKTNEQIVREDVKLSDHHGDYQDWLKQELGEDDYEDDLEEKLGENWEEVRENAWNGEHYKNTDFVPHDPSRGGEEDALGTEEADVDFHIKPGDDLQSHFMKEVFNDLGGKDFLEDIAVSDITLRHQTSEEDKSIEEAGGYGGDQNRAKQASTHLTETPWVMGFEMDNMDEDLNGADVGLSAIENLDEEWENTNQSRVEDDINADRDEWAEDQLDSIYQDTGYDSWYNDKFENLMENGGRVDNERYQENIPSFEEFQAERLRGDEFPSYEDWIEEGVDNYGDSHAFPSYEDWKNLKAEGGGDIGGFGSTSGVSTTFDEWLEDNKQSVIDNFREGRDLDEGWDDDRILERIPQNEIEQQWVDALAYDGELDESNYENEKSDYFDSNEESIRDAYNDVRDSHVSDNNATEQDYEDSIPDLWEEWNQERTERLDSIKQDYKAPKISHVQIRRTAKKAGIGQTGKEKIFDILTHWKNNKGEWKLHRKLTKIPHNELKEVLAGVTGESRFNDMSVRKSLQKLSSSAMSALAGWWLGGDIEDINRRISEPTAAQQREFERQIQRAMRKKDKNISKSNALQKLQLFFSTQTDNNDTYVRRKSLENAVTKPDSEEELLKILGMPPFAGARFDPSSHRWTKPENFGQTYAARGGKKRIRGTGTGVHERSVSGHGKGRIRGEGAGAKFKGETHVAASRRKAKHTRQRKA